MLDFNFSFESSTLNSYSTLNLLGKGFQNEPLEKVPKCLGGKVFKIRGF